MRAKVEPRDWKRPENIYFWIALIFCSLFAVITPPFLVADENLHLIRSYLISEGQLFETEGEIAKSVVDFDAEIKGLDLGYHPDKRIDPRVLTIWFIKPLEKEIKSYAATPTTSNYAPVMYFPQTVGIWIAKALNFPPYQLLLTTRMVNMIFGILVTTLAIKVSPFRKWSLVFIGLLPMTLSLYGSGSADTFTIAICLLYTSLILRLREKPITRNGIIVIAGLSILLAFVKPGYVLLSLIVFILPIQPDNKNADRLIKVAIVGASLILFLVWTLVSSSFEAEPFAQFPGVDPSGQLAYVMSHPIKFLILLLRDLAIDMAGIVVMFIGVMGWVDTALPFWVYGIYEICLGFILFFDNTYGVQLNKNVRWILLGTFLFNFILIYCVFYFTYTPVSANFINGFQGRYVLPIASLVFFAFFNSRKGLQFGKIYLLIPLWVAGAILSIIVVFQRYFGT